MSVTAMKVIVIVMLLIIVGSLFSALFYLYRDHGQGRQRTVRALTIRISLSITLFVLIMAGYYFGIIPQTGLR